MVTLPRNVLLAITCAASSGQQGVRAAAEDLDRLRADAARLDWMEKQQRVRVGHIGATVVVSWYAVEGPLRAAIDAEMQSEGREP